MAITIEINTVEAWQETPSVRTFAFEPADPSFEYQPGQYISVELPGVDDPRGPMRPFTLSSSPTERGSLHITSKMTGTPFKEALCRLAERGGKPGGELKLRGPMGGFTLEPARPAVMIAGGIGITPFRSMIRYLNDQDRDPPVVLVYSNDTPGNIVFREELDSLAGIADWLKVIHTITRPEDSKEPWSGHTGYVDAGLLETAAGGLEQPLFYVCGPPGMVAAVSEALTHGLGIPDYDLRSETFTGY